MAFFVLYDYKIYVHIGSDGLNGLTSMCITNILGLSVSYFSTIVFDSQ